MRVLADAAKNIECLPAVWTGVLHAIRRHEWQLVMFRQIRELPVDPILTAQEVSLDLDKDIVSTEDVNKKLCAVRGILTLGRARALACNMRRLAEWITNVREIVQAERVSSEGAGNSTRGACAPQQCNESFRILLQLVPLNCTLSLLTAQMRLRQQLAQIFVTCAVLHEHRQNASILHAQFGAHNRSNTLLAGGDRKAL